MPHGFLAHLIVTAALLLLVANAIDGIEIKGAVAAVLAAFVLGLVNALVRPVALVLTLPLTMVTFGLFLLVLNGGMLKLAAVFVPGFRIHGWLPAIWASLLLTILNVLIDAVMGPGYPDGQP
jgi:putative membrane protein